MSLALRRRLPHAPTRGVSTDFLAGRVVLTLPWQLVSSANARGHWALSARRAKRLREALALAWPRSARGVVRDGAWPRCQVTLTRFAPRLLDGDNCQAAFKGVRDITAFMLCAPHAADVKSIGQWDADERLAWLYRQEKAAEYAVRIELERRDNA